MQPSSKKTLTLNDIPDFVLLECLSYLNYMENGKVALVSKRFWHLANDEFLWRKLFILSKFSLTPPYVPISLQSSYPFKDILLQKPYLKSRHASLYTPVKFGGGFWKRNSLMAPVILLSGAYYLFKQLERLYTKPTVFSITLFIFNLARLLAFYQLFRDLYNNQCSMGKNAHATFYDQYKTVKQLFIHEPEVNSFSANDLLIIESNDPPTKEQFDQVVFGESIFLQHRQEGDIFYAPTQTHSTGFSKTSSDITIQRLAPLVDNSAFLQTLEAMRHNPEQKQQRRAWQNTYNGRIACQIINAAILKNPQETKHTSVRRKNEINFTSSYYMLGWSYALSAWLELAFKITRLLLPQKIAAFKIFSLSAILMTSVLIDFLDKKLNAKIDKQPPRIDFQDVPAYDFLKRFGLFQDAVVFPEPRRSVYKLE